MNILIIGSKGFIGSNVFNFLSTEIGFECWGCDVILDRNEERYFLIDGLNAEFEICFKEVEFQVCINCSGAADVFASMENPYRDYLLNTVNVFKILEAIRKESPKCKFLNISSAAVYGNPTQIPVSESHDLKPLSPYGLHKKQAEEICREFNKFYGISTCSARVFSAFGRGLKKQLFWDVYCKSGKNKKVILYGTGNETRDFIFIDDLVRALYLIIINAPFNGESINVASGKKIKINYAVSTLLGKLKWQGEVLFDGQVRRGDPLYWEADIDLLKSYNFIQKYTLEKGLEKYVEWLEEIR